MIKAHTNFQIHEDNTALELSKDFIKLIIGRCEEYTRRYKIFFTLWEQPTEFAAFRFASLDLKHFSDFSKGILNGNIDNGAVYYTPSTMTNFSENIELYKKIDIHKEISGLVQNNCSLPIWMGETANGNYSQIILEYIKNLIANGVNEFSLNYDFSFCPNCGKVTKGIVEKCNNCSIKENTIRTISKITDYYSPLELWNLGKREEFKKRRRIVI
jgi:anaerobic ribonucleoside-triphosphate reductase